MEVNEILVIAMFASFILLLFTGFPVAWVLGGLAVVFTLVGMYSDEYWDTFTGIDMNYAGLVVDRIWGLMGNWVLVALPMFIFMGLMLDRSGIAADLLKNFVRLFGRVRGGMAITITLIGVLLAASTGIIGASVVLLALLGIPIMMQQHYQKELACGTVCSVGTLGILIPPSIMLVLMADQLALSVGDLFLGALFPGVLLGVLYILYIFIYARLKPEVAPLPENAENIDMRIVWAVLKAVLPPAGLILAVLGTIFFGIATPTEASGVGAFGAMVLAAWNRKLNFAVLRDVLEQTTRTTAFIFAIFIGATAYSVVLRGLGGDEFIESLLEALPFGPYGVLLVVLLFTFILGFFLDWIEITLIVLPLVAPVIVNLGFDPIWFTVLFAVCLQTSFLTPPVGFALFYLKGVTPPGIEIRHIYRGVLPFILLQLLGLLIVMSFPAIVTWLPAVAYAQ